MRDTIAKFSTWFYRQFEKSTFIFVFILVLGGLSYSSYLDREGFPAIQFPLVVVNGSYFVNDAEIVDKQVAKPFSDAVAEHPTVNNVTTNALPNVFGSSVVFEEGTSLDDGLATLETIAEDLDLPKDATLNFTAIDPSGYLFEYDVLLAAYSVDQSTSLSSLEDSAEKLSEEFVALSQVDSAEVVSPFSTATNPATDQQQTIQRSIGRVGISKDGQLNFYQNIIIGVKRADKTDILELSDALNSKTKELNSSTNTPIMTVVGADFAVQLRDDITSLQSNLLTGILAVVFVSLLLIGWRSTFLTGLFIAAVMISIFAAMFVLGYTINTITLFALVLALGLFVDDATIIVEAIDASAKDKKKRSLQVIREATRKVGMASLAGTLTTVLVFLPLVFVTGVLGDFIRVLPITVVIALILSYIMSLSFIPFVSRFTFFKLRNKKEPSLLVRIHDLTDSISSKISSYVRSSTKTVSAASILVSILVILSGGIFASRAGFNIFPPSKDANQLIVEITHSPNTSIIEAEEISDSINSVLSQNYNNEVTRVLYGGFNGSNNRSADISLRLLPGDQRDEKASEIANRIERDLLLAVGSEARVKVRQVDPGPPSNDFPFLVQVYGDKNDTIGFTTQLRNYLADYNFKLSSGETVAVTDTIINYTDSVTRNNGRQFVELGVKFDSEQTTAALNALQADVEDYISQQDLASSNLVKDDIGFDFGQESENADSFAALGVIFPVAILAMYILLRFQFRSFLQPLLIFLAIPFSFTGAFLALDLSDNPISFFSQIGFIGLIGIAVNNTILLTDYANQERRKGKSAREAIAQATNDRFRPLLATTITTIVALLPLAISDPFWQPLAVTIIGGLVSSTLLVIVSFPFYYLAAENTRAWVKSKFIKNAQA